MFPNSPISTALVCLHEHQTQNIFLGAHIINIVVANVLRKLRCSFDFIVQFYLFNIQMLVYHNKRFSVGGYASESPNAGL